MNNFYGFFFIASFLICIICDLTNSEPATSCTGSFMPDPDDCSKFYQCDRGQPIPLRCAGGLNWNAKINACDWPQNAPCKKTNEPNAQPNSNAPAVPDKPDTPSNQPEPAPAEPASKDPASSDEPSQPNSKCGSQKKSVCYCEY